MGGYREPPRELVTPSLMIPGVFFCFQLTGCSTLRNMALLSLIPNSCWSLTQENGFDAGLRGDGEDGVEPDGQIARSPARALPFPASAEPLAVIFSHPESF